MGGSCGMLYDTHSSFGLVGFVGVFMGDFTLVACFLVVCFVAYGSMACMLSRNLVGLGLG